jgi:hypothetical protein
MKIFLCVYCEKQWQYIMFLSVIKQTSTICVVTMKITVETKKAHNKRVSERIDMRLHNNHIFSVNRFQYFIFFLHYYATTRKINTNA